MDLSLWTFARFGINDPILPNAAALTELVVGSKRIIAALLALAKGDKAQH
jgi:hypothetical protein